MYELGRELCKAFEEARQAAVVTLGHEDGVLLVDVGVGVTVAVKLVVLLGVLRLGVCATQREDESRDQGGARVQVLINAVGTRSRERERDREPRPMRAEERRFHGTFWRRRIEW